MNKLIRIILSLLILTTYNCTKRNFKQLHPSPVIEQSTCDTLSTISYSLQVVKILNDNCNNCHYTGGTSPDLTNYNGTLSSAQNNLLSSVVWDGNASNMPKSAAKMSTCDITIIKKWILAGAPNN